MYCIDSCVKYLYIIYIYNRFLGRWRIHFAKPLSTVITSLCETCLSKSCGTSQTRLALGSKTMLSDICERRRLTHIVTPGNAKTHLSHRAMRRLTLSHQATRRLTLSHTPTQNEIATVDHGDACSFRSNLFVYLLTVAGNLFPSSSCPPFSELVFRDGSEWQALSKNPNELTND